MSWAHGALFSEVIPEQQIVEKRDALGQTQYQGLFQQPPVSDDDVDFEADDFS